MKLNKNFLLIAAGSALEYYDFVLYGLLASYISKTFFPTSEGTLSLIQGFSIFALGYLVRPLGGTILGIIADRYSKIKVFTFSMLLMGVSTLSIGLLPSYETLGIISPLLLVLARLIQGISFASELPGAVTILSESSFQKNLSSSIGSLMASTNFGFLTASLAIYIVHLLLTADQVLSWGWRVPFIIGGFLAFVGYYIRREFSVSVEFKDLYEYRNKKPMKQFFSDIFTSSSLSLITGIGITSLIASGTIFFIYLPHFLEEYFTLNPKDISLCFSIGLVTFVIFCIQFGRLIKIFNVTLFFLGTVISFPIVIYLVILYLHSTANLSSLLTLFIFYEIYMAALFTSGLSILSQLFPSPVRNTCISFCYNISFSIFSLTPIMLTCLISLTKNIKIVPLLFVALSIVTFITFLPRRQKAIT